LETIGEIENIAASKLNYNDVLNKPLPKANLESFKPKFFDKIGVMEKIGEKRFIPIKVHTNSDPAIEKLPSSKIPKQKSKPIIMKLKMIKSAILAKASSVRKEKITIILSHRSNL